MPELIIMRHAKSDWGAAFDSDHERPLAPRGVTAARLMGRLLTTAGLTPELVLTSTAVRARTTVELASEGGQWKCEIVGVAEFYGSDPQTVMHHLSTMRDLPDRVLIAGHEPTWSSLVGALIGGGRVRMPTAAVAHVDFGESSWRDLAPRCGQLRWLLTPKLVKAFL
jgi:phosphohistidine phosphatase